MRKIGYLGPEGTYTEEAVALYDAAATRLPLASIETVFATLASGKIDCAVVPIENVIQGPVTETLDNLYWYADKIHISDMVVLPIVHALGSLHADDSVECIFSKDQALKQCSDYLEQTYPKAKRTETPSTAFAMQKIVDEKLVQAAVIGSEASLKAYGLTILAHDIGNTKNNKTRFAILERLKAATVEGDGPFATQIVVYPHHDRVGLLDTILSVVSRTYKLNLHSIHSRPDTRGGFRFYLEIEGHKEEPAVKECLQALMKQLGNNAIEVLDFGSYRHIPFAEQLIQTIGIIGGTGKMGQWFEHFFKHAGYQVLIAGRKTALSYIECVKQSDVVMVNVPIKNTLEVIAEISPYLTDKQLLVDNTSIKTQPVKAMLKAIDGKAEVLGMHTIFGPSIESLHGQNVVFTRTPLSGKLAQEFETIFFKYGANITQTTPEYHDKQMALHQNLEHFSKIVMAQVLCRHFADASSLEAYASPHSRATIHTIKRILNSDPELYAEIQTYNLQGLGLIKDFVKSAESISQMIQLGDTAKIVELLQQTHQILQKACFNLSE